MKKKALMAGMLAMTMLWGCSSKKASETLDVKDEVVVELGDKVALNPKLFLNEVPEEDILDSIELDSLLKTSSDYTYTGFTNEVKTAGKDYLMPGTYTIKLKLDGKAYETKLVVKDTTAPTFVSSPRTLVVALGDEDFDLAEKYSADDLDEVVISTEGEFDVYTAGDYPVTIVAEDASGNRNTLDVIVRVISENQVVNAGDVDEEDYNSIQIDTTPIVNAETSADEDADLQQSDPAVDQNASEDTLQSETDTNTDSSACVVSNAPAGAQIYRSFEEAYNAGLAWNAQNENNYFFYTAGTDDCGNAVYVLSLGTKEQ